MSLSSVSLFETNYKELSAHPPNVVLLPWGATEAHNYHLPYASDALQAGRIAEMAAEKAQENGAKVVVLPVIPFGSNGQQLDQITTIHLSTMTAHRILEDVIQSLLKQNIDRLMLINSHGGNNFKPLIRDLQSRFPILIVLVNLYEMIPDQIEQIFEDPGDHAGELETSMMMYLHENRINLSQAGRGERIPFKLKTLRKAGVWTPRPWSQSHPDTGSGNPEKATIEKGKQYVNALCDELSDVIVELSSASKGDLPYI